MKYLKLIVFVMVMTFIVGCNNQGITKKELKSEIDSVSYAIGMDIANNLNRGFDEVDKDLLLQGIRNGIDSTNLLLEYEKVPNIVRSYMTKKQAEQRKKQQEDAMKLQEEAIKKAEEEFGEVKKEGEAFLEKNKDKKGVEVTDSGLQYEVIKKGNGVKLNPGDKVKVHYHGTLIDGTVFDSSVDKGTPYETYVDRGVIRGWIEAFKVMDVGSKYRIFVPQELAYGAFPHRGGKVRPFDMLIFEVEVLEIVK